MSEGRRKVIQTKFPRAQGSLGAVERKGARGPPGRLRPGTLSAPAAQTDESKRGTHLRGWR